MSFFAEYKRDLFYLSLIGALATAIGLLWVREPAAPAPAGPEAAVSGADPAREPPDARAIAFGKKLKDNYDSEELLFQLLPRLKKLADGAVNLSLPDYKSGELFAEEVRLRDLAGVPDTAAEASIASLGVSAQTWAPAAGEETRDRGSLAIWQAYLDEVRYFEHAKFYFVDGRFADEARTHWDAQVGFSGLARMQDGSWQSVKASADTIWRQAAGVRADPFAGWRIERWDTTGFSTTAAREPLFSEVVDKAIPDSDTRATLRDSEHERQVLRYIRDETYQPYELFRPPSWDRHPGLAVVDLDRDGFDDIYTMNLLGRNQFLRNRGDGTFEEIAREVGLAIEDHSSSALFADVDNDGDADVVIGRTLEPSLYLMNEDGRFVDRSATHVDGRMPYWVSSISAIDYDNDGLLDLYIATYASQSMGAIKHNLSRFMHRDDVTHWDALRLASNHETFVNSPGPPNILLRNLGEGRFAEVMDTPLRLFKHSYQCSWADYDDDGDMDVYCANDFAPDNLLRNEGGGRFVDVTAGAGFDAIGLGMGASWGDYDRDGRLDLYVSNMFSKAGMRITGKIDGLDPRYGQTALGNFLLRNEGGRFRRVSGSTPGTLAVERAGWSWGSQFVDVDNDGDLDIHALNGFYTAPEDVARPGDT